MIHFPLRTGPRLALEASREREIRVETAVAGRFLAMTVLDELIALLELEPIEEGIFRGRSQDLGWGIVFGGQVLAQALAAAVATVPVERRVHSFHAYFLLPGDVTRPVIYDVERIRDGRSFSTRRVRAIQKGRDIFYLTASFQVEESGLDHQDPMPEVPGPEGLPSEREAFGEDIHRVPEAMRHRLEADFPIEMRPVHFYNPLHPEKAPPVRHVWIRAAGRLPDDPRVHQYLLAYASDFNFLSVALQPHGRSFLTGVRGATIDHAMWFHRPFRVDDWLLYAVDSPSASGSRGLVRGQFFARDGRLVASTAQEGLLREPRAGS